MKEKKIVVCIVLSVFCILIAIPSFVSADESKMTKRVEGILGFYYGGLSGEYSDDEGRDYEVDNLGHGASYILGAGIWFDQVFRDNISLGLEYQFSSANMSAHCSENLATGGDELDGELDLKSNTLFLNFAFRKNDTRWHPYAGAGLGISRVSLKAQGINRDYNSWTGTYRNRGGRINDSFIAPVVQLFAGLDYDFTENIYGGIVTKWGYTSGDLFDVDVSYSTLSTLFKIGYRF